MTTELEMRFVAPIDIAHPRWKRLAFLVTVMSSLLLLISVLNDFKQPTRLTDEERIELIFSSCGDLCKPSLRKKLYSPEHNKEYRYVNVTTEHCRTLYSNSYITQSSHKAPRTIPSKFINDFTLSGRIPLVYRYKNEVTSPGKVIWSRQKIDEASRKIQHKALYGTFGYAATTDTLRLLRALHIHNARVLVLGSYEPWIEVAALVAGAAETVTLVQHAVECEHEQMSTYTPSEFADLYLSGTLREFDIVLAYSTLEHYGLGRYGDALSPYGDIIAVAMATCVTRRTGRLILEVPRMKRDLLVFNMNRFYGK